MVRVHLTISLFSERMKEEFSCELLKKITIWEGEKTTYGRQVKGRKGNKERVDSGQEKTLSQRHVFLVFAFLSLDSRKLSPG